MIIIAPITSQIKNIYPFEVEITVDGKPAKIMLNQSRAIDKSRLGRKINSVHNDTIKAVEEALKIVFGLS